MADLQPVQPGDAITARWANALRDAVADLAAGRVPAELMQGFVAQMLATLDPERFVVCKIAAVRTDESVGPIGQRASLEGSWWPSQVRYRVRGVGRPGIDKDNLVPFYGREVEGDEARIYPAKVHMTCLLEIDVDGEGTRVSRLMLLPGSERLKIRRCGAA